MNLPEAYLAFLNAGKKLNLKEVLNYEDLADIEYVAAADLEIKTSRVHTSNFESNLNIEKQDPSGMLQIKYVDLADYNEFLVWYPELKCFGQFDAEHAYYFAFQNTKWEDIENDPDKYLCGMFDWEEGWDYILNPFDFKFEIIKDAPKSKPLKASDFDLKTLSFNYEKTYLNLLTLAPLGRKAKISVITDDDHEVLFYYEEGKKVIPEEALELVQVDVATNKVSRRSSFYKLSDFAIVPLGFKGSIDENKHEILKKSFNLREEDHVIYYLLSIHKKQKYWVNSQSSMKLYKDKDKYHNFMYKSGLRIGQPERVYQIVNCLGWELVVVCGNENGVCKILHDNYPIPFHYQVLAPYNEKRETYSVQKEQLSIGDTVVLDHFSKVEVTRPKIKEQLWTIREINKVGDANNIDKDYYELSYKAANKKDYKEAIECLKKCFETPDQYDMENVHIDIASYYFERNIDKAVYHLLEAEKVAKEKDVKLHPAFHINLGYAYLYTFDNEKALPFLSEAIKTLTTDEDYSRFSEKVETLQFLKAQHEIVIGDVAKGLDFIEKATDFDNVDNEVAVYTFFMFYGYTKLKDIEAAKKWKEAFREDYDCLEDIQDIVLIRKLSSEINFDSPI